MGWIYRTENSLLTSEKHRDATFSFSARFSFSIKCTTVMKKVEKLATNIQFNYSDTHPNLKNLHSNLVGLNTNKEKSRCGSKNQ